MQTRMMTRTVLVTLAVLAAAAAQAEGLRWKFQEGETLEYILHRGVEGAINLSGSDITFTLGMTFDTTWKATGVADDGTNDVALTVDRIQIVMDSPLFGRMAYDSKDPNEPEGPVWQQMKPVMTNMLGQTFTLKISPLGEVSDIKLPEKLADALAKQNVGENRRQGFGIGGNSFDEKGIKELIAKSVLPLPETTGEDVTWQQVFENDIPGIGKQTTETTFSAAGVEEQDGKPLAKITAETEILFEPAENPRADLEIVEQEAAATFYFDSKAGHLVKADGKQSTEMEITGPQEVTQRITETTSMRIGKSPDKLATASDDKKDAEEK